MPQRHWGEKPHHRRAAENGPPAMRQTIAKEPNGSIVETLPRGRPAQPMTLESPKCLGSPDMSRQNARTTERAGFIRDSPRRSDQADLGGVRLGTGAGNRRGRTTRIHVREQVAKKHADSFVIGCATGGLKARDLEGIDNGGGRRLRCNVSLPSNAFVPLGFMPWRAAGHPAFLPGSALST